MIVGCCDSRAAPETIFDAAPGELFVIPSTSPISCRPMIRTASITAPRPPSSSASWASRCATSWSWAMAAAAASRPSSPAGEAPAVANLDATAFLGKWISLIAPASSSARIRSRRPTASGRSNSHRSANRSENLRTFPSIKEISRRSARSNCTAPWFDISTGELHVLDPGSTGGSTWRRGSGGGPPPRPSPPRGRGAAAGVVREAVEVRPHPLPSWRGWKKSSFEQRTSAHMRAIDAAHLLSLPGSTRQPELRPASPQQRPQDWSRRVKPGDDNLCIGLLDTLPKAPSRRLLARLDQLAVDQHFGDLHRR